MSRKNSNIYASSRSKPTIQPVPLKSIVKWDLTTKLIFTKNNFRFVNPWSELRIDARQSKKKNYLLCSICLLGKLKFMWGKYRSFDNVLYNVLYVMIYLYWMLRTVLPAIVLCLNWLWINNISLETSLIMCCLSPIWIT